MDEWKYQPAGDQGLDPHASLRSLKREAGLVATVTQTAWRVVVRAYLRGYHRLRVDGVEHIPAKPPFVMIATGCRQSARTSRICRVTRCSRSTGW